MDYDHKQIQAYADERIEISTVDLMQKEQAKQEAFEVMDELDGWCTKTKASILIELIFISKAETVVEIGVWGGKSLIPMAFALKSLAKGKIYGVDPWCTDESAEGMTGAHKDWWSAVDHESIYQGLVTAIRKYKLGKHIELIRKSSEQADPIMNIDILHIDGNHSEKTSLYDVRKWVPLVKKGGFIIFDDTTWGTTDKAVAWLDKHCVRVANFREDNDWAIWVKP